MTWLETLLAEHPEISLDDFGDRVALVDRIERAFPSELVTDVLRGSLGAVIRLAWTESQITAANLALIDKLAEVGAASVAAIMWSQPGDPLDRMRALAAELEKLARGAASPALDQDAIREAYRRVGNVAIARIDRYRAQLERDQAVNELTAAKAEVAYLREQLELARGPSHPDGCRDNFCERCYGPAIAIQDDAT